MLDPTSRPEAMPAPATPRREPAAEPRSLPALLGLGTRLAALAILATPGVAVAKVHAPKGFSNMAGGFEFNALIAATALGLLLAGPGPLSLHELVQRRLQGRARWLPLPDRRSVRVAKLLR